MVREKGHGKAIVAVAHKLLRNLYGMIVRGRDYDHAVAGNVRRKMSEMRRKARWITTVPALAATVGRFTPDALERLSREASIR